MGKPTPWAGYFEKSRQIAKALNAHAEKIGESHPEYRKVLKNYTQKHIHYNGTQFFAGFAAAGTGEDINHYLDVPILIELVMLRAYKTNRIVDRKQDVWTSDKALQRTVLEENMLLSLKMQLTENIRKTLDKKKFETIQRIVLELICNMGKGFWLEREKLNANVSKNAPSGWEENYAERNHLFNAVYDYAPLVGYYCATGDNEIFSKYREFFSGEKVRISHSGQIINDLSDFANSHDEQVKSYQDNFSDLRNHIITYPIRELISEKELVDAWEDSEIMTDPEWKAKMIEKVKKSGLPQKVKALAAKSHADNLEFWKSAGVDDDFLSQSYGFLMHNKYFTELEKL